MIFFVMVTPVVTKLGRGRFSTDCQFYLMLCFKRPITNLLVHMLICSKVVKGTNNAAKQLYDEKSHKRRNAETDTNLEPGSWISLEIVASSNLPERFGLDYFCLDHDLILSPIKIDSDFLWTILLKGNVSRVGRFLQIALFKSRSFSFSLHKMTSLNNHLQDFLTQHFTFAGLLSC